ncbi:phosphotransferase enzyme family protein [Paenibacillus sp. CF384]|uniref:phosphotransferase enzyme family protein n=1 Tax=Paenibacillus sp. CF384 TaxID=1884382 RepID=UPI0008955208|nr:phosphotransferase [Paenibacillus sp. CF384]SDX03830.1 Ser/Thr protein kinase RdoA involved in Cpx stress response, MazF antagonist [Paenibacillus sp. CF384]
MENVITDLFHRHGVLAIAAERYGLSVEEVTLIGGFQNFVYEYQRSGREYILRITPGSRRTVGAVKAELEWIRYLVGHGISASMPILSAAGEWTEVIVTAEMFFTAVSFEKAPGQKVGYPACLDDDALYEALGRITGNMHALSKLYQPEDDSAHRLEWRQNDYLKDIDILPPSHQRVKENYSLMVSRLNDMPTDRDTYGLIHGDMGIGNFVRDEGDGKITLFDFDEAQYSWFVEDIAIQLYYLVYVYGGEDGRELREDQARRFMRSFMKGYNLENTLSEEDLKQIPLFLMLRELIVYIGAFRDFDGDESFSSSDNQWFKDWIAESKVRLERNMPIVDIW